MIKQITNAIIADEMLSQHKKIICIEFIKHRKYKSHYNQATKYVNEPSSIMITLVDNNMYSLQLECYFEDFMESYNKILSFIEDQLEMSIGEFTDDTFNYITEVDASGKIFYLPEYLSKKYMVETLWLHDFKSTFTLDYV